MARGVINSICESGQAEFLFILHIAPEYEVHMSMNFSDVLAREMRQAGLPAALQDMYVSSSPIPAHTCSNNPSRPDTLELSCRARSLSASFQEFAREWGQNRQNVTTLVAGNDDTGYIWATDGKLHGRMAFTTVSGIGVTIRAEQGASPEDVLFFVVKDGEEHVYGIAEVAAAAEEFDISPLPALEALPRRESRSTSGRLASQSYNARALPVHHWSSSVVAVS